MGERDKWIPETVLPIDTAGKFGSGEWVVNDEEQGCVISGKCYEQLEMFVNDYRYSSAHKWNGKLFNGYYIEVRRKDLYSVFDVNAGSESKRYFKGLTDLLKKCGVSSEITELIGGWYY